MGLIILAILIKEKVVGSSSSALQLTAVIVTNIIYEGFLMFLLAYGLVEFPRSVWNTADFKKHLLLTQMKASQEYKDISDCKIEIQLSIGKVQFFKNDVSTFASLWFSETASQ